MPDPASPAPSPADTARRLLRTATAATVATTMEDGSPYASLVEIATRADGTPLLLISTLAQHTMNLDKRPAASLLIDATAAAASAARLAGARVSLQGRAVRTDDPADRARYLARHPHAALYADFKDFGFFAVELKRAHLVAGFGKIDWVDADQILTPAPALAARAADVVGHMNEDHADAVALYAEVLLGHPAGTADDPWRMIGVDAAGADLYRAETGAVRLDFDQPVDDAEGARVELVRLVKRARRTAD